MTRLTIIVLAGTRERAWAAARARGIPAPHVLFPSSPADLDGFDGLRILVDWSLPSHPWASSLSDWVAARIADDRAKAGPRNLAKWQAQRRGTPVD